MGYLILQFWQGAVWEWSFACDNWDELLLSISISLHNALSELLYPYFTKEITVLCMCKTKHLQLVIYYLL